MFLVSLIEVLSTRNEQSREDLQGNCTHVSKNYWLFEGDLESLHDGILLNVMGESHIHGYGDLNSHEIIDMVSIYFDISKRALI